MSLPPGARPSDLAARWRVIALLLMRGELAARGDGGRRVANPGRAVADRAARPGTSAPSGKDSA
jgi:hypothetical protein